MQSRSSKTQNLKVYIIYKVANGHRCPKGGQHKKKGTKMKAVNKFLFVLCTLLICGVGNVWGYSYTGLTVNVEGSGIVAVTKNSTKPANSAFGSTSTQETDHDKIYEVTIKDTYYIWVKPSSGWRCTGISGDDLNATWNDAGYYTVSFRGNTKRDSRTMTATFVANFYTKAVAHAVPTVGKVWVGVGGANVGDGTNSRGWSNPGSSYTYDWTLVEASSGPKYSYHFYKEDPDGYAFDGWYTNAACTSLHKSDADFVEYVTATTTEKTDLEYWAHWKPVTVNSVNPTSTTLNFTEPGTKSATLTFNVSNADSKADFNTPTISNNEWTLSSWNYANNQVTVVVSYTVTQSTSKDSNHAATVTLTSKGTSDNQSMSATVSVSLNMNPVFTCNLSDDPYLVDDAALNLASLWTSSSKGKISYTIESFVASGINNEGATQPKIVNDILSLGQAGTVELKLTQAASVSYNAGWTTKTITINKRENAISNTYKWRDDNHTAWTERLSFETGAYVSFYSNNKDVGAPVIRVIPKTGTEFATFYPDSVTVDDENGDFFWSLWNVGVATWEVSQPENYKYKAAAAKTFEIVVNINNDPTKCSCNIYEESHKWGEERIASEIDSIGFGAVGDTLHFDIFRNGLAGNTAKYSLYTENGWSSTTNVSSESLSEYTHYGPIDLTTNGNTTAVRFAPSHNMEWWGSDTDDPYINNIRVTRRRWMKILRDSKTEITSLPKMERIVDADTAYAIFYVDFSTCDSLVKIASDDAHVTFGGKTNRDTISENPSSNTKRGYTEQDEVIVRYYSDVPEEKTVTITIYTEYENKTITVKVKTIGYVFEGKTDDDWTKASNWNVNKVPTEINDVTIEAAALVSTEQSVRSMDITTGSVTIAPQGGLTVGKGGISGATENNLILKADADVDSKTKGQTAYLRISPEYKGAMPRATVELFSIAYYNMKATDRNNEATWQYVGSPMVGGAAARPTYPKSMLYDWSETTGKWTNNLRDLILQPFTGYATSQYRDPNGMLISNKGQLVANQNVVLNLTYTEKSATPGCNVFANSYSAPIDITRIDTTDFSEGVEATIHLFNTGSKVNIQEIKDTKSIDVKAAGQYLSIPVKNAIVLATEFQYPTVIPSMQGFYVNTNKAGTLTLDYSKLVWNSAKPNIPLRVKANYSEHAPITASLMMTLSTDSMMDNLFLLESEDYAASYENGYDALKMNSGEFNIFAVEGDDHLSVDATDRIKGTRIGVRTGAKMVYTLYLSRVRTDRELLLFDNETNEITNIYEGLEYTFNAEPDTIITDRFQILEREKEVPEITEVTTAIKNAEKQGVKVNKFIKDNQLYILKNGVLYNATGARVH